MRRTLPGFLGALTLTAGLALAGPASALANNGASTCWGGSVSPGTYANLVIAGDCFLDSGDVTVTKNLSVAPGAAFYAAFGSSRLVVDGNLGVGSGAVLVLGCEPEAFPCFDNESLTTHDWIGGNLDAQSALTVIAHSNTINHNLTLNAGGGGYNCDPQSLVFGFPAYATFEDNTINGQASLTNWTSCWLGFIRNTVSKTLTFNDNSTADPDGNEIVTNTISGDLNCVGNSPAPQIGDSGGSLNTVSGKATGQCTSLVP